MEIIFDFSKHKNCVQICAYNYKQSFSMYTDKSVVEITIQVNTFTLHQDIMQGNNFLYDDQVVS